MIHSKRWVVRHAAAGTLRPAPETPHRASRLGHLPDADVTVALALNRGLYVRESEILDVVIDAVVIQRFSHPRSRTARRGLRPHGG